MAFFDMLNDLANTATEKAGSAIENGKAAISISREEKKIRGFSCQIGEIIVNRLDCGMEPDPEIRGLYNCILAARREIERLRSETCEPSCEECCTEEPILCPHCGQGNPPGSLFCCGCGTRLEE